MGHYRKKIHKLLQRVYRDARSNPGPVTFLLFNCMLVAGLTNTIIIIRVVLSESREFRELDLQSLDPTI